MTVVVLLAGIWCAGMLFVFALCRAAATTEPLHEPDWDQAYVTELVDVKP